MDDRDFLRYLDEAGIKDGALRIIALFGYCCGFGDGREDALQEKEKKEGEEG